MSGNQELKQSQKDVPNVKAPTGIKKRRIPVTWGRVRELFNYDPESGVVTRRVNVRGGGRTRKGEVVGFYNDQGYLMVSLQGRRYRLHRIIWLWMEGYWPEGEVDHISRIRDDNRWCNLRVVNRQCNMRNSCVQDRNKTGIKGVFRNDRRNKWQVNVRLLGTTHTVGRFDDKVEAASHRLAAEQCLGFPDCNTSSSAYQYMQKYLKGEL